MVAAAALSVGNPARAGGILTAAEVMGFSGPTWAPQSFTPNPPITDSAFGAVGVAVLPSYPSTDILDPSNHDTNGVFSMNIDLSDAVVTSSADPDISGETDFSFALSHAQNDNLNLQIYNGSNQLVTVFDAAQPVIFGETGFSTQNGPIIGLYWFAFTESTNTPYAQTGDTIAGYYGGSDIKVFDMTAVPAPRYSESGLIFLSAAGLWGLGRRLFRGGAGLAVAS
jgi:hypothetical protein